MKKFRNIAIAMMVVALVTGCGAASAAPKEQVEQTTTTEAVEPAQTAETTVEPAQTAETTVEPAQTAETAVEPAQTAETAVEPAQTAETAVEPAQTEEEIIFCVEIDTEMKAAVFINGDVLHYDDWDGNVRIIGGDTYTPDLPFPIENTEEWREFFNSVYNE